MVVHINIHNNADPIMNIKFNSQFFKEIQAGIIATSEGKGMNEDSIDIIMNISLYPIVLVKKSIILFIITSKLSIIFILII